jgi:pimeloyl-ACP methyl ester carboxylesterase
MRRSIWKITRIALVSIIVIALVVVAGALGYRAYRQHQNRTALAIHTPNGIQEAMFVEIGGLRQWVQIRGEDRANPVLLFVHGGPDISMIPFTYRVMKPWEKQFTVAQWDQRGAGRTYFLNGGADETSSGMDQIVDDGVRVSEFVRARLHKEKIIVVGESWGSAIATEMVRRRPDLFYAYVGTGQMVDEARAHSVGYRLLLARVRAEGDEAAIQQLTKLGPPPYAEPAKGAAEEQILGEYADKWEHTGAMGGDYLFAPGYSLRDVYRLIAGPAKHRSEILREDEKYDALSRGTRFEIPMFYFQGSDDLQAPTEMVEDYVKQISAPQKTLVVFPGGGHNTFYFFSDRFLEELDARVRPLASRG